MNLRIMKSRILKKLLLLLMLLGMVLSTGYAFNIHLLGKGSQVVYADKGGGGAGGDDDKGAGDSETSGNDSANDQYSFYHVASSAATYFDASQNSNTKVKFMENSGLRIGNAGGLIGYEDSKYDKNNWIGAMTSSLSSSAQGHSYQTYASGKLKPIYYFVLYGHALNSLGLDSTASKASVEVIFRKLFGWLMIIAYATAVSVPMIFQGVIHLLVALNPFQFFVGSIQEYANSHYEAIVDNAARTAQHQQGGNSSQAMQAGLQSLTNLVHGIFVNSQQIGMAIIPITLLISIGLYFMFNLKMSSILKKAFLRLFVLVLGIPLLADCYTNSLTVLENNTDNFSPAANEIIASTFDDFQGWVANTELAMPEGAYITLNMRDSTSGQIADNTNGGHGTTEVRDLARKVNHLADNGLIKDMDSNQGYQGSNVWHGGNLWHGNLMTPGDMASGFNVLGRYANDARYEASDFETSYKANPYGVNGNADTNTVARGEMLAAIKYLATNQQAWYTDGKDYFKPGTQPKGGKMRADFLWNASPGGIKVSPSGGLRGTVTFSGTASSGADNNTVRGLSSMAMYNYLTMSFSDSTVTAYSMGKLSSMMVAESHHSVNLIGTSTTKWGYLLNAFIVLICITVIGWGYAIAMLMSTLSNMFKILVHAPWAAMGFLTSAAKLITCVLLLIAQIFVTLFMFQISMDMLMALNMGLASTFNNKNIINNQMPGTDMGDATSGFIGVSHHLVNAVQTLSGNRMFPVMGASAINFSANSMGTLIYLAVASLITLLFTLIALRMRGQLVSGIGEAIGNLFDKIFLTGASNPLSQIAAPGTGGAAEARDDGGMSTLGSVAQNAMYLTSMSSNRDHNSSNSHNPLNSHTNPKNNSKNSTKNSNKGPNGKSPKDGDTKKIGADGDKKGNLGSFDRQNAENLTPKGDLADMADKSNSKAAGRGQDGSHEDGIPMGSFKSDNVPASATNGNKSLGDVAKDNADSMNNADVSNNAAKDADANSNLGQAAQDNAQEAEDQASDMQDSMASQADQAQDMPDVSGADAAAQDGQVEADQNGQAMQNDLQDQDDQDADQTMPDDTSQNADAAQAAAQDGQVEADQNGQDMQNDLQDQAGQDTDQNADQTMPSDTSQNTDAAQTAAQDSQAQAAQDGQAMQNDLQDQAPQDASQAQNAQNSAQASQATDAAQTAAQDSTNQASRNGQAMQQQMAQNRQTAGQNSSASQTGPAQADRSASAGQGQRMSAAQTAAQDSTNQASRNGQAMSQQMAQNRQTAGQNSSASQTGPAQADRSASAGQGQRMSAAQTAAQDSTNQASRNGQAMGQQMSQSRPAGSVSRQTAANNSGMRGAAAATAQNQIGQTSHGIKQLSSIGGQTASVNRSVSGTKPLTPVGNVRQQSVSSIPTSRPSAGINNVSSSNPTSVNAPVNTSANASQINNANNSQYANSRQIFNNKIPTNRQPAINNARRLTNAMPSQSAPSPRNINTRRPVNVPTMPNNSNVVNNTRQNINRVQGSVSGQAGNATRRTAREGVNFDTSNLNSRRKK